MTGGDERVYFKSLGRAYPYLKKLTELRSKDEGTKLTGEFQKTG